MYIFAAILLQAVIAIVNGQYYKPSILLYKPKPETRFSLPEEAFKMNVDDVANTVNSLKANNIDIIIVPEYALTDIKSKLLFEHQLNGYGIKLGKVKDQVCSNTTAESPLQKLACAAKNNGVYLMVNLIEEEDGKHYVTNLGFDSSGYICVKCRQEHYANKSHFTKPSNENICTFTATFKTQDVKFSVMNAMDMSNAIPEARKSDNVIMTSSMENALPFNMGLSLYQGYAIANGVNLLVASFIDNAKYYIGSGIFLSNGSHTIAFGSGSQQSFEQTVPIVASALPIVNVETNLIVDKKPELNLLYNNITVLNNTNKTWKECSGDKCCNFEANLTGNNIGSYRWVMVSGKTPIVEQEVDVVLCALILPSASLTPINFNSININTTLDKGRITVMSLPIILNKDWLPTNFQFNRDEHSVTLNKPDNIIVFGVIDVLGGIAPAPAPGSNTTLIVIIVILVLILIALLIAFFVWRQRQAKNRRNF